jgi:2-polyprenyl-6-methoxyphenol hydroxylase-like FAD-dependent oxidoreductase
VTTAGTVARPALISESWGRGERFGIVDIGFREVYWFACADAPPGGLDVDVQAELRRRFGGWHAPIQELIEATPSAGIVRTDIYDRAPVRKWHDQRVVLLGDAAHPMTPNLGQGAGQAIEDAAVLDESLAGGGTVEEALLAYEQRRVRRANGIVRAARQLGAVAQWRHPAAAWLRNSLMRLVPASVGAAQARRLMRGDA